ncbi:MAG: tRNA pseudouridine(55) synthase TruB [Phycisphaerae bacterium]|nr:tRNA pseudouridine(55) synthase TruB [Phycisphaerae bacterium]
MFGFLNIWKPPGPSSFDMIRQVRRCVGRREKIGHAGTLDPLAEGILVLCLGQATRLVDLVHSYPKHYATLARLGATSTTDDAEGQISQIDVNSPPPALKQVEQILRQFTGVIEQVPPAFSAVKVAGRRAYKIARSGRTPDLAAKKVTIHSLEIIEYEYPRLRLRVSCGSGTYIRSLVRDIGDKLGVGGYCEEIIRESVGPFGADRAVRPEQINADNIERFLISPVEAVPPEARITLTDEQARELAHGRAIDFSGKPDSREKLLGAVNQNGDLIGLTRPDQTTGQLRPEKVFILP